MTGTFSCIDHNQTSATISANVDLGPIKDALDALVKVADVIGKREPANIEVHPSEVHIAAPSINVEVPKIEAPSVNLTLPPTNPPAVIVSQQIDSRVFRMFSAVIVADILIRAVELAMRFK